MSAKDELNYEFSFFESEDSLAKYSTKKKKKTINTEKIIAVTLFLSIIISLEVFLAQKLNIFLYFYLVIKIIKDVFF
jgi:glucose-6-phosphate-specific signal transduction histidine kinase